MRKIILIALILFVAAYATQIGRAQTDESGEPAQAKEPSNPGQTSLTREETEAAAEAEEGEKGEGLSKKISLDLRGMDIVDTVKFLAMKGNLNIVTSKSVTGRTTLFLKDVTIADTLDVLLLTNKLACETKKNIIAIMTEAEYEALYGEKYIDKREIKALKLKYALSSKVGQALESLKSSIGKIIMDDATGTLILIDTPEKIAEMERTADDLDRGLVEKLPPTVTRVFELDYAEAEAIEEKISGALTADLGTIHSDERTNKLIVKDLPNKVKEIEEMVAAFDAKTREVFIEAKIIEITLSDEFALGVNWERIFKTTSRHIRFIGAFPASGITSSYGQIAIGTWKRGFYTDDGTADQAWNAGTLDGRQTQQILTFLRELGDIRIVSSPHIAVCNNEEAKIMVGTRQPYATSTISQSETTATTSWSAEFVDVGVTLTVTPTINKDGFVKMNIKPEVSTLTDWFEIQDESGTTQIRLPEVDTSNAETDVLVQDGRTIIIAGLIKETTSKSDSRIPLLGDIPLLGNLFKSQSSGKEMKELVIFLTPHIISGGEDLLFVEDREKVKKPRKK